MVRNDRRVQRNPAGYLVESIRQNYSPPKGYESTAERSRKLEADEQRRHEDVAAKQRADMAERAEQQAELKKIARFWGDLSPAEKDKIKEEAVAAANPF